MLSLLVASGCSRAGNDLVSRNLADGSVEVQVCEGVPVTSISFADPADDPGLGSVPLVWQLKGRSTSDFEIDAPAVPKGFDDDGARPSDKSGPHKLNIFLASTDGVDVGEADLGEVSGKVSDWPIVRIVRTTCSRAGARKSGVVSD